MMGQALVVAGLFCSLGALVPSAWLRLLGLAAAACHGLAFAWLTSRFLADDFTYRQVWSQSDPHLSWWLKLAGPWSGDAGTLLLLALLAALLGVHLSRHGRAAAIGAAALSAAFAAGALVWSPFEATTAAELSDAPYRGMNAHLTSVWMLVHPPLIFAAYLLIVAPVGAMCAALAFADPAWRGIAARTGRVGWLLISSGIGFGMWWAYEDFTYGTLWHWDPVQTSVFAAWCFLTAMLHLQSRYRPDGAFAVTHPLLGLAAAASVMLAMAVTRSESLASSHRYVGDTSLVLLVGIAVAILISAIGACLWHAFRGRGHRRRVTPNPVVLWVATSFFIACGLAAQVHLGLAYYGAHFDLPRPDDLKPFFETLRNFASASELADLRAAFAQWEVDNFAMNRWLAPLFIAAGLAGAHLVLPLRRSSRWICTGLVLGATAATVVWGQPFARLFDGRGLTSGKTVALFSVLDALVVALAYLLLATGMLAYSRLRHRLGAMSVAVALVHAGAVLALFGGLSATVFDSYAQRLVSLPDSLGKPQHFAGGYSVTIGAVKGQAAEDGGRGSAGEGAFRTLGEVSWSLRRDGMSVDGGSGHTVYRDARDRATEGTGAIRLMCAAIDYRFARYRSGDSQIMHPLISRGILQDVQIWLPAVVPDEPAAGATGGADRQVPLVLKRFPLMSLVWAGLAIAFVGAAWHTVRHLVKEPPQISAS